MTTTPHAHSTDVLSCDRQLQSGVPLLVEHSFLHAIDMNCREMNSAKSYVRVTRQPMAARQTKQTWPPNGCYDL